MKNNTNNSNNNNNNNKPRKYFKSLEKKRLEWQTKLDKAKLNFVVDKIIGVRHNFVRNYSIFSSDKFSPFSKTNMSPREAFNKSNDGIRSNIVYKLEKDNPTKYRKKICERDSFASIYQKKTSVSSLIYVQNSKRIKGFGIQKSLNEKVAKVNLIIPNDNYDNNVNNKDVLPLIDDNSKQPRRYFNLSISKSNHSL